jgi:uncharacterized membrane-anchored protein YhcB (DUF1043 family)
VTPGMEQAIFVGVAAAVIGTVIGYFAGRRASPGIQQLREMTQRFEDAEVEKQRYAQQVNTHFLETANKLNKLTEDYQEVYQHLADGAAALCAADSAPGFNALGSPAAKDAQVIESDSVVVEPPRDYAPRTSPDDPGMLNERYGLDGDVPPHSKDSASSS